MQNDEESKNGIENCISQVSDSTTRLEIKGQDENGKEIWVDAGAIEVDDNIMRAQTSVTSSLKKALPKNIRSIVSPNTNNKSERKSHYLFRNSILDMINTNLMVFLHGAGDTHTPFDALGKKMSLPQTALLSISAKSCGHGFVSLPLGLGYSWFEEMDAWGYTLADDHPNRLTSLDSAISKLDEIIKALTKSWVSERIFLFGFSAGACLAMEECLYRLEQDKSPLGGAVCIAGGIKRPFLSEKTQRHIRNGTKKNLTSDKATPILMITGSIDETFSPMKMNNSSEAYKQYSSQKGISSLVKTFVKQGKGHNMIGSHEEMRIVMGFLSELLVRESFAPR